MSAQIKRFISKHLPAVPVFFNESPDLQGWLEGAPGAGRIVGIKSVCMSDGSSRRYYKVEPIKTKDKDRHHEKRT